MVRWLDDDGRVLARRRVPTPRGDYQQTLSAIVTLVREVECDAGATGTVGIGIPGTISPATGLVKNSNSTWMNGRPLADDLPGMLDRPVRFANDANCLALSESADGAAAGAGIVFAVIIGTGTGGGVAVHGRVLVGCNAIAGEWGHNPLPAPRESELPGPPGQVVRQPLDVVAAAPRIDDAAGVRFLLEEQLRVAGDAGREVARQGQGLVQGVGVQRLGVPVDGGHRLQAGADDVAVNVLGGQAPAARLAVRPQRQALGVLRAERLDQP